jgi:general secretion pathway protein K
MRLGRGGSMLVMALWVLSLLSLFALSLGTGVRQKATLLSRLSTLDALYPIAYSGVEHAKSLVRADYSTDIDILTDGWAFRPSAERRTPIAGGSFSFVTPGISAVVDEERKVNLNRANPQIVSRLLQQVSGLEKDQAEDLVYCLIDWMDSDSFFGHPEYGAEASYYEGLPEPYTAKNSAYESMDELMLVKGMTPEVFERLRPYVTVYGSGQVNVNTASREVLAALGLSPAAVEAIALYRAGTDKIDGTSDDQFFSAAGSIASQLESTETPLDASQVVTIAGLIAEGRIGVSSTFFSTTSHGLHERTGATLDVEAVFDREYQVVYQRVGEVRWPARS